MRSRTSALFLLASLLMLAAPLHSKDTDWLPVTAADLTFKDPGGRAAVILYYQVDRDDTPVDGSTESVYVREKILTDEGKKNADIEIPYWKEWSRVEDIKARVIQPDGSIVPFDGKVYDKTVVKSKTIKILVRTFSLPNVQAGSLIEYRYKLRWTVSSLIDTTWRIQQELPIKHARFTLKPYTGETRQPISLAWLEVGMPEGYKPVAQQGLYTLEMNDVPALPDEKFAPPADWNRMEVRFLYIGDPDVNLGPDGFWQKKAHRYSDRLEDFVGHHSGTDAEVAQLIKPTDTPEQKLRKLYARAQQVHNLSYDREKEEKEAKHDKVENKNVDDVLRHGAGTIWEVTALFIAMARSAGFEAYLVRASARDKYVFSQKILDEDQLNVVITVVTLNGKEVFLDPGTIFCPFGLLPWERTGVSALVISRAGGRFVTTPQPRAADAITFREAALHLADGKLEGTLRVTFRGAEALRWRLDQRYNDDTQKKKDLVEEVQRWLATGATIELTNVTGWTTTDEPLVAEYKLSIPGAVTQTGKRLLLPTALFQTNDTHPFQHAERVLPVYYSFPYREIDDVVVSLPPGYQLEGKPEPKTIQTGFSQYQHTVTMEGNSVHVIRRFEIDGYYFQTQFYGTLRSFYDNVRAGDDETLVMKTQAGAQ